MTLTHLLWVFSFALRKTVALYPSDEILGSASTVSALCAVVSSVVSFVETVTRFEFANAFYSYKYRPSMEPYSFGAKKRKNTKNRTSFRYNSSL